MLPPEIVDIVGKTYCFGISIDGNNSSVMVTFNAMKVWSLNDAIWKRTKFLHQNSIASRNKQCKVLKNVDESGIGSQIVQSPPISSSRFGTLSQTPYVASTSMGYCRSKINICCVMIFFRDPFYA